MDTMKAIENGVTAGRVSSQKQAIWGDSIPGQRNQLDAKILEVAQRQNCSIPIVKDFHLIQSASGDYEVQPMLAVIAFCSDPRNKVKHVFITSIDRATRAGSAVYTLLTAALESKGVLLWDARGVIRNEKVNALEDLGVCFPSFSVSKTSQVAEILEAERAKKDREETLNRLFRKEITYVRMGYWNSQTNIGFNVERIETINGMRMTLVPHPQESHWLIRMFGLLAQGNLTEEEIVEMVNAIGFKTRIQRLHDKEDYRLVVGHKGGKPLTVKYMKKLVSNPIYCGIYQHKWRQGQPLDKTFDGLVSIELFNKANRGKMTVVEVDGHYEVVKGDIAAWRKKKDKLNPNYPYKHYIVCPHCRKNPYGSASKSSNGEHVPAYHCNRKKHKYWGMNAQKVDIAITSFVCNVRFTDEYVMQFRETVLREFEKRRTNALSDGLAFDEYITKVEMEQKNISEQIEKLTLAPLIRKQEEKYARLEQDLDKAKTAKAKHERTKLEAQRVIDEFNYFMEHTEKLLMGSTNPLQNAAMFGLLFDELPTYDELISGTAKLCCLFKLKDAYEVSNSEFAARLGPEYSLIALFFGH